SRAVAPHSWPIGVGAKALATQLAPVVISGRHPLPAYQQLSRYSLPNFSPSLIHHIHVRVGRRPADRHLQSQVALHVIAMDHAAHRGLRRPILVDDLYSPLKALPGPPRQLRL